MAYSKQTWENGTSPLSADRFNHMEDGIEEAYEHGGGKTQILWENEDPTSIFTVQEITLSSDDYDILEIFYVRTYGSGNQDNQMMSVKVIKGFNGLLHGNWSGSSNTTLMRMITRNSDISYTFGTGYQSGTAKDTIIIPLYIIGYKTGLFDTNNNE